MLSQLGHKENMHVYMTSVSQKHMRVKELFCSSNTMRAKGFVCLVTHAAAAVVMQFLQPFRDMVGKPLHIKVLVDLFAAALEALSILWASLCPTKLRGALRQPFAKPGHGSLV